MESGDEAMAERFQHAGREDHEEVRVKAVPVQAAQAFDARFDAVAAYGECDFVP